MELYLYQSEEESKEYFSVSFKFFFYSYLYSSLFCTRYSTGNPWRLPSNCHNLSQVCPTYTLHSEAKWIEFLKRVRPTGYECNLYELFFDKVDAFKLTGKYWAALMEQCMIIHFDTITISFLHLVTPSLVILATVLPASSPGAEPATSVQSPPIGEAGRREEVPSSASALATLSLVSDLSVVPHSDQGQ
jgi:hypothetical protein